MTTVVARLDDVLFTLLVLTPEGSPDRWSSMRSPTVARGMIATIALSGSTRFKRGCEVDVSAAFKRSESDEARTPFLLREILEPRSRVELLQIVEEFVLRYGAVADVLDFRSAARKHPGARLRYESRELGEEACAFLRRIAHLSQEELEALAEEGTEAGKCLIRQILRVRMGPLMIPREPKVTLGEVSHGE